MKAKKLNRTAIHSSQRWDFCCLLSKLTSYQQKQSTVKRNFPVFQPYHTLHSTFTAVVRGVLPKINNATVIREYVDMYEFPLNLQEHRTMQENGCYTCSPCQHLARFPRPQMRFWISPKSQKQRKEHWGFARIFSPSAILPKKMRISPFLGLAWWSYDVSFAQISSYSVFICIFGEAYCFSYYSAFTV